MKDGDEDVDSKEGLLELEGLLEGLLVVLCVGRTVGEIDWQMIVGIADGAEVDGSADGCIEDGLRVAATERFNDGSYDEEVDG